MKKTLALLLAVLMVVGVFAGCGPTDPPTTTGPNTTTTPADTTPAPTETTEAPLVVETFPEGDYVYKDSVITLSANWNPHTYQTTDESYPIDFLSSGLYSFIFNDELNPVEGKDPYSGYVIVPEMAAAMPVDVTEQIKAEHPEFGIPESATAGYAYVIDLNPAATWNDGTPINADTYVESMKRLLDPKLMNYRSTDYIDGDFAVANAAYYLNQGQTVTISIATVMANEGLADLDAFIAAHGDDVAWINWYYSFGNVYDAATESWVAPTVNAVEQTTMTINDMVPFYVDAAQTVVGVDEATGYEWLLDEVYVEWTYPENYDFANVGIMKTGDYQITLVLGKSLAGFNLLYNLGGNWIVKTDLYDACLNENEGVWTSTYNTSLETTASYGPYVMTDYQTDKHMRFERNENWYGYTDGKHIYTDPVDGKTYPMYQTTAIDTQVVGEAATRKLMFLKGELMGYGLQAEDFATYRQSDYCYATPGQAIFFMILNGHMDAIKTREAAADFDQATTDLETMTLESFRKAVAVTYDKDLFASTISPARSGAFGIVGTAYVYDPETGAKYRDTDQAKQILCDVYSVDTSKFASLDEAVASITGYDPVAAKELYTQAFQDALAAGYITDNDNDGISDQTVTITYSLSEDSDFQTKTINYMNEKMNEVTAGTPFENKILFVKSAPLGDPGWSDNIKAGMTDTVLGGWNGSVLNPFSLTDLYVNPTRAYDGAWFDATTVELTINVPVDGEDTDVTMTLYNWSDALNGATVTVDGKDYNFGDGMADVETRLDILAAIEGTVLRTYNYLPMLQDGSMALLSQQVYYVVEEYNPVMGRGGIQYMKYNYNEADWAAYIADQGGELKY